MSDNIKIIKAGLWQNNPAIVQLLGLCPLLAVSNSTINAFTLGMATIFVLIVSNVTISLLKKHISYNLRIPYFMLIIASIVTLIIFFLQAYSYNLYKTLGLYLALITTNCVILARVEAFAYKESISKAFLDGLSHGLGFTIVLLVLGAIREIIGQGTLFANFSQLFGSHANHWVIHISNTSYTFLLAILPPGAFLTMGFLIACKNYVSDHRNKTETKANIIYEQAATLSAIPKISTKKP